MLSNGLIRIIPRLQSQRLQETQEGLFCLEFSMKRVKATISLDITKSKDNLQTKQRSRDETFLLTEVHIY